MCLSDSLTGFCRPPQLLSCASVHLAWLHRSHALDNILAGRTDLAAVSLDQHTRYFATSVSLVAAALSMSRAAFLMEGSAQAATLNAEEHDARLDYIREAVEHCILVHCLSGGRGFRATMDFLHDLRRSKGGPRDVLEAARESGDKKKLRRVRVAMENAASWEVWSESLIPHRFIVVRMAIRLTSVAPAFSKARFPPAALRKSSMNLSIRGFLIQASPQRTRNMQPPALTRIGGFL